MDALTTLRERCETLIEENRQLREVLAPAKVFPLEWGLRPAHARILNCFLASPNGVRTKGQLEAVACRGDTESENALKVHIAGLRRRLEPLGVEIKVRYSVGYELPQASREILLRAMA